MSLKNILTLVLTATISVFNHFEAVGKNEVNGTAAKPDLPVFKTDKIYTNTRLANGMHVYFATNPTQKGMMDIALIQKVDPSYAESQLGDIAVDNFYKVKALSSSFREFLTRNGIAATEDGYFDVEKGSIRYNFCNLSSAMPESVIDSTLLAVFDLAKRYAQIGAPTAAEAIVVVGDFDKKEMLTKLKLLSMITPTAAGDVAHFQYQWDSLATPRHLVVTKDGALATIEAIWKEPRTPKEYMQTVMPVISDKLIQEMGIVMQRRLDAVLKLNKVNAWMEFTHRDCSQSPYDDQIRFTVNCMSSDAPLVEDIVERELSRLLTWGVDEVEYGYARDIHRFRWLKASLNPIKENSTLRHNCVAAFLYGAPLASEADKIEFAYREMPLQTQTSLFNNYIKRLLSLTVPANEKLNRRAYLMPQDEIDAVLNQFIPAQSKTPKETPEQVTGGSMWKYQNGVNFIHKRMPQTGITHFCYASRGGRAAADEDKVMDVEGIDGEALQSYLKANGIDISLKMTPHDVRLQGSVMDDKLPLLLKYLCAVSAQKANEEVFGESCLKMLILTSGKDSQEISSLISKYVNGLGAGSTWSVREPVIEDRDDITALKNFVLYESVFPFDHTGANMAIADIAAYALADAITEEFHNAPVYFHNWSSYAGYSVGEYRLLCGVKRFRLLSSKNSLDNMNNFQIEARMEKVLREIARKGVSKQKLEIYRSMAKNVHFTRVNSPEFCIDCALDRYFDNKNYWTRYPQLLDNVKSEDIMKFYVATLTANR